MAEEAAQSLSWSAAQSELATELRSRLSARLAELVEAGSPVARVSPSERQELRTKLAWLAERSLKTMWQRQMTPPQRERLVDELLSDTLGFGPIQAALDDPSVSEILINGPSEVFVERAGRLERTRIRFRDREHLLAVVEKLFAGSGRQVSIAEPYVDARLEEGLRVNVVAAPVALDGPYVTIRKPLRELLTLERLVELETLTEEAARWLLRCVRARLNLLVSGPASSGKTTLLNLLVQGVPLEERIVLIEDTAELQLIGHHVVRLEARLPSLEGRGEVTIRHLLKNALHMRPDRILIGEVRGEEALDMLQAMTAGNDGSMATVHANRPEEALDRIVTLALLSRAELSPEAVTRQVRSAVDLVVHLERLADGSRKVMQIAEVQRDGQEPLQPLFVRAPETSLHAGRLIPTDARLGVPGVWRPREKSR
jgi:pilus assembly protein CpaF